MYKKQPCAPAQAFTVEFLSPFYTKKLVHNLELKARYKNLDQAVELAEALELSREWSRKQVDTYFVVPEGKLKLRQVEGRAAELISYKRPEKVNAKVSDYRLYHSSNGDVLAETLSHVLEVDLQVIKERTLFMWHNVRIHLDKVERLGHFIEFEVVMGETDDLETAHERIDFLMIHFGIQADHLVDVGYYELLKSELYQNA